MADIHMIITDRIKKSTFIDDNVDEKMLKIAILDAQQQIVLPILGDLLYEKILDGLLNATISATYQALVVNYIWPVFYQAVPFMLSWNLLYQFAASSITKTDNENSRSVSKDELNVLIGQREQGMKVHKDRLKKHLMAFSSTYPEYLGAQDIDGKSPDLTEDNLSWYDYTND